jgi:hypothetical protein
VAAGSETESRPSEIHWLARLLLALFDTTVGSASSA